MNEEKFSKQQLQNILDAAKNCIQIEADAVSNLTYQIDDNFSSIVTEIFSSNGRLVITGIGKSAIVAQKIVATLNSTGTPSLFMHAADAIHGDLGMIQSNDLVLCISKSGETPEIKVLVPLVKKMGSRLIAMVSNKESSLGKQADFILCTPISQEAEPNNLAPTASTTVQMAMGDAIAVALLSLRGFSTDHFAKFHPGGSLGKQLYLKVSDMYPMHGKPQVKSDSTLNEVILEMTSNRLGVTAVINDQSNIIGIITDGDLRRMLQNDISFHTLLAKNIMSLNPITVDSEVLAIDALRIMQDKKISQILVVDQLKYVGVIHVHDLMKEGIF